MADDCIGPRVDELVGEIPEGGVLNDAFAIAHKAHASTEGIAHHLRPCVSGFLMQKVCSLSLKKYINTFFFRKNEHLITYDP